MLKPEFIFISIDWSRPTRMCYHNTNGLVAGDVIMLLQKARLKKIHNTLIFATINIINTLLPVHALLDWQKGNVGIIERLVGKLSDWNMWCSCYQKALAIQIMLTHVKSDFASYTTNLLPLVTKIQNFPSWWIISNIVNKVGWPAWLLQGLCTPPESLTDFVSCLVGSVLQIAGSKNKAGHKPDWGSPAYFHADWRFGVLSLKKRFWHKKMLGIVS